VVGVNPDLDETEMGEVDDDEYDSAFSDLTDEQLADTETLQAQIDAIAIEDPAERKAAAKRWHTELEG
jgi:hypothetical protein